jgi:hypothetical protein
MPEQALRSHLGVHPREGSTVVAGTYRLLLPGSIGRYLARLQPQTTLLSDQSLVPAARLVVVVSVSHHWNSGNTAPTDSSPAKPAWNCPCSRIGS